MKKNKKGFTLVELLAVIVILAIILVIAVPKVMSVIEDSKKATLESTAKMIASSAEKEKVQNTILGKETQITCDSVAKINKIDYEDCDIEFDDNTAKVTIKGSGKFAGLNVCEGTKTNASATNESCETVSLIVDLDGGTVSENQNGKYEAGSTIILTEPIKEEYTFKEWIIESGEDAILNGSKLIIGTTLTKVKAIWEEEQPTVTIVSFEEDSWETIVAAVQQAEIKGTEYPYSVGNTKTIEMDIDGNDTLEQYTIRVANTKKCNTLEIEPLSKTACGFVLEFADVISTHNMNNSDTNIGGWPASKMRSYVNSTIYNAIPSTLRDGIISTYVVSGYGSNTSIGNLEDDNAGILEDGNYWSNDKLYLLSAYEIWKCDPGKDTIAKDTITRQLDYYETYKGNNYTGVSATNYEGAIKKSGTTAALWWIRSVMSNYSNGFYRATKTGIYSFANAGISSTGVSPAFRLAN